jgi:hypothetical protein
MSLAHLFERNSSTTIQSVLSHRSEKRLTFRMTIEFLNILKSDESSFSRVFEYAGGDLCT